MPDSVPIGRGSSLGSFEILSLLGRGGMGEVWRARDSRLGREVAVKVLPAELTADPDRLARFSREARLLAQLEHPGVAAVHSFERVNGLQILVMELVPGESLAERVARGPIPPEEAVVIARQIAGALEAAHERGIVHRDLKPANVMLQPDGRVKLLDFGLAKAWFGEPGPPGDLSASPTMSGRGTEAGLILGTAGYMSPEQARGRPVDRRADIWAFGVLLFEMLTGSQLFAGETVSDVLAAVLRATPDWDKLPRSTPAALRRLLARCLERDPLLRLRDIGEARIALATGSDAGSSAERTGEGGGPAPRSRGWLRRASLAAAFVATGLLGLSVSRVFPASSPASPSYRQVTFERGTVRRGRFAPDGENIVYSASWNGGPVRTCLTRPGSWDSRPLPLPEADVLAMSGRGELLLLLGSKVRGWLLSGSLAAMDLLGTTPRSLLGDACEADWLPDGERLAVVRRVGGRDRLEFPRGKTVYETTGYVAYIRVSPRGDQVAFLDHPVYGDNRGWVSVVDGEGRLRRLTTDWIQLEGLAWTPDGREIWFTGMEGTIRDWNAELYAVSPKSAPGTRPREVWHVPRDLALLDIHRSGAALLSMSSGFGGTIVVRARPDQKERELGWMAFSTGTWLSASGDQLLLTNYDPPSGEEYQVFLRPTDGSSAIRLGPGNGTDISDDGRRVLSVVYGKSARLLLLPTGAGEPLVLPTGGLRPVDARFHPDGLRAVVLCETRDSKLRGFLVRLDGKGPAQTLPGVDEALSRVSSYILNEAQVSSDGRSLFLAGNGELLAAPLGPGAVVAVPGLRDGERLVRWHGNGAEVLVASRDGSVLQVDALEVATGRRRPRRTIDVADASGYASVPRVLLSADGKAYGYTFNRYLNSLYVVEGLR